MFCIELRSWGLALAIEHMGHLSAEVSKVLCKDGLSQAAFTDALERMQLVSMVARLVAFSSLFALESCVRSYFGLICVQVFTFLDHEGVCL